MFLGNLYKRTCSYRFQVYHRAVGHDCVVSFDVYLALVVTGVRETIDGAALGTSADGHTGCGLVASHTVDCTRPTHNVLWLLHRTGKTLIYKAATLAMFKCANSSNPTSVQLILYLTLMSVGP